MAPSSRGTSDILNRYLPLVVLINRMKCLLVGIFGDDAVVTEEGWPSLERSFCVLKSRPLTRKLHTVLYLRLICLCFARVMFNQYVIECFPFSVFLVCSSWTNKLITAKDHRSVQINIGHLDESGVYTNSFSTFALCGQVRSRVR